MTAKLDDALEPINSMIGALAPKLRGALVEELVDQISRERPDAASRKALVLDNIVAQALRDAPLPSRVRASPKLARCVGTLPESTLTLAFDVVTVAEAILTAPELTDDLLMRVCAPERQEHMKIIARRSSLSSPLAETIAEHGEPATVLMLMRNAGARFSREGLDRIAALYGSDPTIRSALAQRADCPADLSARIGAVVPKEMLTGDALVEKLLELSAEREIFGAMDLLMRCIGRDAEAGRKIIERDDEKALGAICHVAGIDAHTYEALVEAWRVSMGKPTADVHKAPVRFRLMRPAEIDRVIARLPLARMRASPDLAPA
jgi:hypothetical protein